MTDMTTPIEVAQIDRPRISAEMFNSLPEPVRRYIMYIETDCDPSGTIRSEMHLRDQVDALEIALKEVRHAAPLPALQSHAALKCAIFHIEHMAWWIASQKASYSFESLGEDMPGMKAALEALRSPSPT